MSLKTINDTSNTSDSDTLIHSDESDLCSSQSVNFRRLILFPEISHGLPNQFQCLLYILDGTFLNYTERNMNKIINRSIQLDEKL